MFIVFLFGDRIILALSARDSLSPAEDSVTLPKQAMQRRPSNARRYSGNDDRETFRRKLVTFYACHDKLEDAP